MENISGTGDFIKQLVEEYGVVSFEEQPDGTLLFEHEYADDDGLVSWMLSCREKVTVLEPESVREKLYQIAGHIAAKYERTESGHGKQSTGRDRSSK